MVATPREARIVGRAEVVSRSGQVASSYSCTSCCPDSGPYSHFDPNAYALYVDGFAFTNGVADYHDCYDNQYFGSFSWSSMWTANTSIATVTGSAGQLNGINAGNTSVAIQYQFFEWYLSQGNCYQYTGSAGDSAPVDVIAVRFRDAALIDTNRTADFDNFNTANLNIDTTLGPNACGGDNFAIKARFDLPDYSASCCSSASTTFVTLTSSNKFHFIGDGYTFYGNDSPPYVIVNLKRNLDGSGTTNGVHVSVGGSYQDGKPYTGQGTVHLVCP